MSCHTVHIGSVFGGRKKSQRKKSHGKKVTEKKSQEIKSQEKMSRNKLLPCSVLEQAYFKLPNNWSSTQEVSPQSWHDRIVLSGTKKAQTLIQTKHKVIKIIIIKIKMFIPNQKLRKSIILFCDFFSCDFFSYPKL